LQVRLGQQRKSRTGKLADLAVLSQDIFTVANNELPNTESVMTLVGGQVVYDATVIGAR
jgi:hypothetical protein